MLETAACADHAGVESATGRGAERRRRALYAIAEVDEVDVEEFLRRTGDRATAATGRAAAANDLREAIVSA